jgi:hypothetical protein
MIGNVQNCEITYIENTELNSKCPLNWQGQLADVSAVLFMKPAVQLCLGPTELSDLM